MIARKVYRNNEPSTATVTNSTVDPNNTNTISEPPAYFWVYDPIPRRCQRCRMFKIKDEGGKPDYICLKKKDFDTCRKNYKLK